MSQNLNSQPTRNKSNSHFHTGQQNINQSVSGANTTQSLFKVLKKSQIDTSSGNGFILSNTMTAAQLRTQSRNNNNPSQSLSQGGPHSHQSNLLAANQFMEGGLTALDLIVTAGSPNITNKKASRNSYAGNTSKKQQYYTQQNNKVADQSRNEMSPTGLSEGRGKNQSVNRQNSNRRMNQQQQIVQQQNATSLQVQNLTQMLKDQSKNNNILPPMTTTSQNKSNYSRNMAYKQSLSESITGKVVKGLSPKSNTEGYFPTGQSPTKNSRAASQINPDHSSGSDQHTNVSLKLNKGSNIAGAGRTRNAAQSLGRQDILGNAKPQFYTMKNGTNTASNANQASPHNYSGRFNNSAVLKGLMQPTNQSINGFGLEYDPTIQFVQSYDPAKFASKRNGVVVSYAANTHQGIIRNYNEDRVSIILNIIQPKFKETKYWPRCSFFGVYDGHGGAACADYLRDQLHQLIVKDPNFPSNPKKAIENAFEEAERSFMEYADNQAIIETGQIDRSGSCAIIALIVGDMCYVANVGDSRAIMSVDGGEKILLLSKDHKPESEDETKRIEENGGRIYQNSNYIPDISPTGKGQMQLIVGPHRVFPGRLSVSRTIGDIEAKEVKYGGNPKVVIPTPDIKCFKIRNNYDFIIIACDGVFEKLNNQDVMNAVWQASKINPRQSQGQLDNRSIHEKCGHSIDRILHTSAFKRTFDNITAVMIAFENFENVAGQATPNTGDETPSLAPPMNLQDYERINALQSNGGLETVIEEEYIQNEEHDPINEEQMAHEQQNTNQQINNNDLITKPVYQANDNTKEDYQLDLGGERQNPQRKPSTENILAQSRDGVNNSQIQRRQSASSPLNSRKKNSTTQVVQGNSQSALNYQSAIIPTRMSFQVQQQLQAQPQTRMSDTSFNMQKAEEQSLKERILESLSSGGNNTGNFKNSSQNVIRNNKSSSIGRRESGNLSRGAIINSQGNPRKQASDLEKGYSSSSRNEGKNLQIYPQQLSLTHSLVGNLAPFTTNYQVDNSRYQPLSTQQVQHKNTRNSQLKQYASLGNGTQIPQTHNIGIPTNTDLDFSKTQLIGSSTNQKGISNQSGKNWFSNTQQLSGISQLHKHLNEKEKRGHKGKNNHL